MTTMIPKANLFGLESVKNRNNDSTLNLERKTIIEKKRKLRSSKIKKIKKTNPFFLPYARNIDSLNNIYVITKLSRQGLNILREDLKKNEPCKIEIEIASVNGIKLTKEKDKSKIVEILKRSIRSEIFGYSLISAISITENFLEDIIRQILRKHPGKLSMDINSQTKKEAQEEKKIDLKEILKATSLQELYDDLINQKLQKLFYASPSDYFKYLKTVIQIELKKDLIENYIEIKATRDLLVHNKGKVNEIYIAKAGNKARAIDYRQNIPITESYFVESVGVLKQIIRDSYECASKEYLKVIEKKNLYPPQKI